MIARNTDIAPDAVHNEPPTRSGRGPLTPSEQITFKQSFLKAFRASGNVAEACRNVGIARRTAYRWRKEDSDFAEDYAEAEEDAIQVLRDAAKRRGVHGWDVPVVSMGKIVMTKDEHGHDTPLLERRYSDPLLLALLKARAPEHRDQRHLELAGASGGAITTEQRVVFVLPQVDDTPPPLPFVDADGGRGSPPTKPALISNHDLCNSEQQDSGVDNE